MATTTETQTTALHLATASGYTSRTVLCTPVRKALPFEIPILDISAIFSNSRAARQTVARSIYEAANNSGFFYIKGHGIPSEITDDLYVVCLEFFQ